MKQNKNNLKNINQNFLNIINSIFLSYTYLENDKKALENALYELETEIIALYDISKSYSEGKISFPVFKGLVIDSVTKETNQMIVVDTNGNEVSDEEKAIQNQLVIGAYDKEELENFTKLFYGILVSARAFVLYKLNDGAVLVTTKGNLMPSRLDFFDKSSAKQQGEPESNSEVDG